MLIKRGGVESQRHVVHSPVLGHVVGQGLQDVQEQLTREGAHPGKRGDFRKVTHDQVQSVFFHVLSLKKNLTTHHFKNLKSYLCVFGFSSNSQFWKNVSYFTYPIYHLIYIPKFKKNELSKKVKTNLTAFCSLQDLNDIVHRHVPLQVVLAKGL